ncbi:MAG TPA: hypothetical protein VK249_31755 [Anaerolineales bacterium]|nr:hypothetical protein [Anaerolineales bacterium]
MKRKIILLWLLPLACFISYSRTVEASAYQELPIGMGGLTPTPQPTHIPLEQKQLYSNPQQGLPFVSEAGLPVRGVLSDWWADVVIGQPNFGQITPNQVVGNKLFNPGGIYVDRSTIPNQLYVYDAGNSRILGFSSLGVCAAGSQIGQSCTSNSDCPGSSCAVNSNKSADLILGQPSPATSACNHDGAFQHYPDLPAPSADSLCGLRPESVSILEGGSYSTMASDSQGNLYHPDYFNNRVLRYNNPFNSDTTADYVWGQLDFVHGGCNQGRSYGQPDNKSLCLAAPLQVGSLKAGVAVDPSGNLWVTDTQNNRVLRFPYSAALGVPAGTADLVLGQANFSTSISGNGLNQMHNPGSIRVDAAGNVYVLDGLDGWGTHGRLLVFSPPFSNGKAASQAFSGIGEPSGLELDPGGGLWINNGDQNKILHLTNGQLQPSVNTIVPVYGGLGIDRDMDILLTGLSSQEVQMYNPPGYGWTSTFLQADDYGFFNQLGPRGMTDPTGLEVTDSQLVISDQSRLLFWNNPSQLTNNYPPADGIVGQPNFTTRPRWDPAYGRLRADTHGRLWVVKGGSGIAQILAYQLPLVTGAQPAIQISSPIPLLGGGNFSWSGDSLVLTGIAYQPDCDCLWLSDRDYNRVFRIRNVSSPQRTVDIVLGQKRDPTTLEIGTHCNQGRDTDDLYARPISPSQDSLCHPGGLTLDRRGNLFVSDHNLEVAGNWRLLEYDVANLPISQTTALFDIPASRVYGRNGSFTEPNCVNNDPLCGSWEPVFDSNNQMIIGFNGYLGTKFPQIYNDPLANSLPYNSLKDFFSHAYSARLDSLNNLYVLDLTRNRVLIYRGQDTVPPAVLSITRADTNLADFTNVHFTVTFSEPVTGMDASLPFNDLALAVTGVTGAAITDVSGSGDTYTVTVNTGNGYGTVRLDIIDDDSIVDESGNPLGGLEAGNGNFNTGEFYTIAEVPAQPVLLLPRNDDLAGAALPSFTWSEVGNADHYEIVFGTDSAFTQNIDPHFVTEPTFTFSSPVPDGKYYWRVRAYNIGSQSGEWSASRYFTIDTLSPLPPVPRLPANNASVRGVPTFRWTIANSAVKYQFEIDNDEDFSSPVFSVIQRVPYRRPPGVLRGTYFWRVRAQDAAGNWSAWSQTFTVNILPLR